MKLKDFIYNRIIMRLPATIFYAIADIRDNIVFKRIGLPSTKTLMLTDMASRTMGPGAVYIRAVTYARFAKRHGLKFVVKDPYFEEYFTNLEYDSTDTAALSIGNILSWYNPMISRKRLHELHMAASTFGMQDHIMSAYKKVNISLGENAVGVCYRGTDYKTTAGHGFVPINDFIIQFKEWSKNNAIDEIYFVSESEEALQAWLREYPNTKFMKKERYTEKDVNGKLLSDSPIKNNSRRENFDLYLADILYLSHCKTIFGPNCGAVLMAAILAGSNTIVHQLKTRSHR